MIDTIFFKPLTQP